MSKLKFIYVPQGCYAEITSLTPDNVLGLVTSGIHSCCSIIVTNSKEGCRYIALCHADYITNLENIEHGLSALIRKACPDGDFTNLIIYVGEEVDLPRNDKEPIYLNQVQRVLRKFQVMKDIYINLESKLVCKTYSVDYGISILRKNLKITEERHEPQVIEEEFNEDDIDMIMLHSDDEAAFPLESSIVHARSYARKENEYNFPTTQSMRFPPICVFNGSSDRFLPLNDIERSCCNYGISWKRIIDDATSSYKGSERYSSDFDSADSNPSENGEASALQINQYEIQFNSILSPFGLHVVNVRGDGNCFFYSLKKQLPELDMSHTELRKVAVTYILDNLEDFQGFTEGSLEEYINQISQNGEWADNPIIQALANALGISINIYGIDGANTMIVSNEAFSRTVNIAYTGNHYLSVEPIQPQEIDEEEIPEILGGTEVSILSPSTEPTKSPTSRMEVNSIESELCDTGRANSTNYTVTLIEDLLETEDTVDVVCLGIISEG